MPLVGQIDVCNSGLRPGAQLRFAGITCSAMPTGASYGSRPESQWVPSVVTVSGLAQRYDTRLTHHVVLT